jgi:nucleoside-diphosphate-sugar epimerase
VTGGNGVLGLSVCEHLLLSGHDILSAIRDNSRPVPSVVNVVVGDIDRGKNWEASLTG